MRCKGLGLGNALHDLALPRRVFQPAPTPTRVLVESTDDAPRTTVLDRQIASRLTAGVTWVILPRRSSPEAWGCYGMLLVKIVGGQRFGASPVAMLAGDGFDHVCSHRLAIACSDRSSLDHHPAPEVSIGEQSCNRIAQLVVLEVVGREPHPEPELGHALGVVELVPEQRQHDHGFPEMQGLGRRVVAAVRYHEVARG